MAVTPVGRKLLLAAETSSAAAPHESLGIAVAIAVAMIIDLISSPLWVPSPGAG